MNRKQKYTSQYSDGLSVTLVILNNTNTVTNTHPFNGLFSTTTCRVSRHKKGYTKLDFNEARDDGGGSGISWAICKSIFNSLQRDNHASTSSLSEFISE